MGNRIDCEIPGASVDLNSQPDQGRRRTRLLGAVLGLLPLATLCAGVLYQSVSTLRDRKRLPPPGRLVSVDGRIVHMLVSGSKKREGDATVVLETGLSGMSSAWGWIQPEVARFARVVSYDRAGLGWSEPDPVPLSAAQTARRLHALLKSQGIEGPYLLAGHSMGGLLLRVFHDLYPDEVCGAVLIDASHPDQHLRSDAIRKHMSAGFRLLRTIPLLVSVGYVRFTNYFKSQSEGLPATHLAQANAFLCSYRHLKATNREAARWDELCREVRATGSFGAKPITVVSAGEVKRPGTQEVQADLARLSSRGRQVVVQGADHVTLVTHREPALKVVAEIRRLFELTRSQHRPLADG